MREIKMLDGSGNVTYQMPTAVKQEEEHHNGQCISESLTTFKPVHRNLDYK